MECLVNQHVNRFFLQYEQATTSSDVAKIGGLYADTFLFGGPDGVQAVKNEDFVRVTPKRKAYFSTMGLSDTNLVSVEVTLIDSAYLLAKVGWSMKLQTTSASKQLDIFATYILRRSSEDALKIVVQIDHQDLSKMIKELQSL